MLRLLHDAGFCYGDAVVSGSIAQGQVVKIAGNDIIAVNTGAGAKNVTSFGVAAKAYVDGQMGCFYRGCILETDVYDGSPAAGDGLYASSNGKLTGGYDDATQAVKAHLDTGTALTNKIVFEATTGGTVGEAISVTLVAAGANTALTVAVTDFDIVVNLATTAVAGTAKSTVAEVLAAIAASTDASSLVRATSSDVGVVAAVTKTQLAGGANACIPVGQALSVSGGILKALIYG